MSEFSKKTKAELVLLCEQKGLNVRGLRKAELVQLLLGESQETEIRDHDPRNENSVGDGTGNRGAYGVSISGDARRELSPTPHFSGLDGANDGQVAQAEDPNLRMRLELARIEFERHKLDHEYRLRCLDRQGSAPTNFPSSDRQSEAQNASIDITKLMPKFDESSTPIDLFLQSFEKICRLRNWTEDTWVHKLPPLLTGKSFNVYSRLSEADCRSYEAVKQALLAAYHVTPDQYRQRFRKIRKEAGESYMEMASRTRESMDAWFQSKEAVNIEAVLEEIAIEQFNRHLSPDLLTWLSDRNPTTLKEAARMADEYTVNRPNMARKVDRQSVGFSSQDTRAVRETNRESPTNRRSNEGNVRSRGLCFNCQKPGHHAVNCNRRPAYRNDQQNRDDRRPVSRMKNVNALTVDNFKLDISIGGEDAIALRDTGADITLVKSKWVDPNNFTGKVLHVRRPLDPEILTVPLATIEATVDGVTFRREVGVTPHLDVDLLLGNDVAIDIPSVFSPLQIAQVQTRAKTRKLAESTAAKRADEESTPQANPAVAIKRPTNILPPDLADISPSLFAELQREDHSLAPLFEKVNEERAHCGARMLVKNGLLYREWKGSVVS